MSKLLELYYVKHPPIIAHRNPVAMASSIFAPHQAYDRFGIINEHNPYNFVAKDIPILDYNKSIPSFRNICLNRAQELIDFSKSLGKPIGVCWSGGVDSTALLCALLLLEVDLSNLIIYWSKGTIKEYPLLYFKLRNILKIKFVEIEFANFFKTADEYDTVYTAGWCADQLFGSDVNQKFPELYTSNWKDGVSAIVRSRFINYFQKEFTQQDIDNFLNLMEYYSTSLNLPLKYTCDFLWMFNFGSKITLISHDLHLAMNPNRVSNIFEFFSGEDFQIWAIQNYQSFHKYNQRTEPKFFKKPMKDIIYEYTKDDDYRNNKGKVGSWSTADRTGVLIQPYLGIIDELGQHYHYINSGMTPSMSSDEKIKLQYVERMKVLRKYIKPEYLEFI